MHWRPTLVVLHRDIGFLCLGLTLAYAISGVAVNHKHHWNYNRSAQIETKSVGKPVELIAGLDTHRSAAIEADPSNMTKHEENALVEKLAQVTGRENPPRNHFWRGPNRMSLYFGKDDSDNVDYAPHSGVLTHTVHRDRFLLRDLNFLHLNEQRSVWTYVADAFAVLLLFLAVSGAIMVKGRKGLMGRGGILAAIGLLVPILAVLAFRYW